MKPPYAIGSVPSLLGHATAYRWRSLPRVRRHRASKPQGSSERVLPWQVTMDQLIFASLSHTHYWYEVGMLKVSAFLNLRITAQSGAVIHLFVFVLHMNRSVPSNIRGFQIRYRGLLDTKLPEDKKPQKNQKTKTNKNKQKKTKKEKNKNKKIRKRESRAQRGTGNRYINGRCVAHILVLYTDARNTKRSTRSRGFAIAPAASASDAPYPPDRNYLAFAYKGIPSTTTSYSQGCQAPTTPCSQGCRTFLLAPPMPLREC